MAVSLIRVLTRFQVSRMTRIGAIALLIATAGGGGLLGRSIVGEQKAIAAEGLDTPTLPLRHVNLGSLNPATADPEELILGWDDRIWGEAGEMGDRQRLLASIDHSLRYLDTAAAVAAYAEYPVPGITRDRVRRSLVRFRQLVLLCRNATELQQAVRAEFEFYQAVGVDGLGTVEFTGYFEPTYAASRSPTADYRYPLYRVPADLDQWESPHPTRLELEGLDGLQGGSGPLRGTELVWLRDRMEAFLVQVQGSARLQLTDGSTMSVGYAGRTDYPYRSVGRMLVDDGKLPEDGLSLPAVLAYFRDRPDERDRYLARNNRFVFFRETNGAPPTGSLDVPVTAERSIATDKSLMPPGALAVLMTPLPVDTPTTTQSPDSNFDAQMADAQIAGSQEMDSQGDEGAIAPPRLEYPLVSRFVLDQDTGGAIRGPGRVDIFMGTGQAAGDRAGRINSSGSLYYLLLREY